MLSPKVAVALASRVALAGVSSMAFAGFTPLPTLAAPTITLKGTFSGTTNGSIPIASPTLLENGKFYGVTIRGGSNDLGAIYEFDPISSNITLKASFNGANGGSASGALTPTGNANGT